MHKFHSTLSRPEGTGTWTYTDVPAEVSAAFGTRGQVKVKGTIDGEPFRSTLMPGGDGGHFLVVNKAIRDKIGKAAGQQVLVELEPDDEPRALCIPDDFQSALAVSEAASANFSNLAYSHRKRHIGHIEEAKTPEARMRRIDKAVEMLADNTRNLE